MAGKQTINAAVVSHKGCVRSNNEDNFFFNGSYMSLEKINDGAVMAHSFTDKRQLYGIFDGMGGGDWGERASTLAATGMQEVYMSMGGGSARKLLKEYALSANARIVKDGSEHQTDTQGTTMAVVLLRGLECSVANVGDSRVYLMRGHKLRQLSEDHSLVADMVREGKMTAEQARKSPKNNVITHYLGMPNGERPDDLMAYSNVTLAAGDRLMLCSDGLCDLLSQERLEEGMATIGKPEACAAQLVQTALEQGGKDNTTVIVLDVGSFTPRMPISADRRPMYPGVVNAAPKEAAPIPSYAAPAPERAPAAAPVPPAIPIAGRRVSNKKDEDTSLL